MKLAKINFISLIVAIVAILSFPAGSFAANDYSSCASLNDFLSYSKCVAEIDSAQTGTVGTTTAPLINDTKTTDGDFSIKIGDGSGRVNSLLVTLTLTASADTVKMSISKDSNFGFAERQDFAKVTTWTLQDLPEETQYVYVKFLDKNDAELKTVMAPVIYSTKKIDTTAETAAKTAYVKIYGKAFNGQAQFDNAWLQIAAYGLPKTISRDLTKEKTALAKFAAVYKKMPKISTDWNLVHAIAYASGDTTVSSTTASTTDTTTATTACVATSLKQIMDVGSKSDEVKSLQTFLQCAGYLASDFKINGLFDDATEAAVKKFQEKYKLACAGGVYCGRVGPGTLKKINEVSATTSPATATTTTASTTPSVVKLQLKNNLTIGSKGAEVTALQKFLAQDPSLYPEAKVNGTFDDATETAVKKFQEKYKLACKDGTYCGYVGPATRSKLTEVSGK